MWPLANDKSWELPLTIIVESFNAFLNMYKYVYVGGGGGGGGEGGGGGGSILSHSVKQD